ncbi:hypothetical protein ACJIZ3_019620 [Penstemon smallii]|uniref:ribose-5-phosphate isomerase n=1 Tax=Penstemon smallii TaxID=265156 RepID=A0ABD3T2X8_9LAMI
MAVAQFFVSDSHTTVEPPQLMVSSSVAAAAAAAAPASRSSVTLTQDDLKKIAAYKAVEHVKSGMVVGLGTGSTAKHAVDRIAYLLQQGKLKDIVGIPTSSITHNQAVSLGIPLSDLDSHPVIDLTIDGADEVDPNLNLVKGRGGSLLREKMVESASKKFIVIVDESKMVKHIGGSKLAMPVEVIPFCWNHSLNRLVSLFADSGCVGELRKSGNCGKAYVTDNGNYIIDLYFERDIGDLNKASDTILRLPGIVEHGMFIGLATSLIVAGVEGITVKTKVGDDLEVDSFCYNDLRNGF